MTKHLLAGVPSSSSHGVHWLAVGA